MKMVETKVPILKKFDLIIYLKDEMRFDLEYNVFCFLKKSLLAWFWIIQLKNGLRYKIGITLKKWNYIFFLFSVGVCASILWSSSSVYSGKYKFGCRSYRHHDQTSHYFPYCSKKRKGLWTCNSSQVASRYVLVVFSINILGPR